MKHIKEVYEKYKHLDSLLSDYDWMVASSDPREAMLYELWQAIKKTVEEQSDGKTM